MNAVATSASASIVNGNATPIASTPMCIGGASNAAFMQHASLQQLRSCSRERSWDRALRQHAGLSESSSQQELLEAVTGSPRISAASMRFSQQHSVIHAARAQTKRLWMSGGRRMEKVSVRHSTRLHRAARD